MHMKLNILLQGTKQNTSRRQKGQVLILAAVAIVGIIAAIGLAIDGGMMFISDGRLRRAVDASAIAAALHYRQHATIEEMTREAQEFLVANGVQDPGVIIRICDTTLDRLDPANLMPDGNSICGPTGYRKLVYVFATASVRLAFLPVIPGFPDHVTINASAISEAASVDVVLALDRSESMTFNRPGDDPQKRRDPSECNKLTSPQGYIGDCEPFNTVKKNAIYFVNQLYFPYDRVAIITFDKHAHVIQALTNNKGTILSKLSQLTVYQAEADDGYDGIHVTWPGNQCFDDDPYTWLGNPCREYTSNPATGGNFEWFGCTQAVLGTGSYAECGTTNIGEALYYAGSEFTDADAVGGSRASALWVVILLTDGEPTAGYSIDDIIHHHTPYTAHCPSDYWTAAPICRPPGKTPDSATYPRWSLDTSKANYNVSPVNGYDAYDLALDQADFVGVDQHAIMFSIGLGDSVVSSTPAKKLLKYAADQGNGRSYITPDANELHQIFLDIANNIATRLEK